MEREEAGRCCGEGASSNLSPSGSGQDCLPLDGWPVLNSSLPEEVTLILEWLTQIRK